MNEAIWRSQIAWSFFVKVSPMGSPMSLEAVSRHEIEDWYSKVEMSPKILDLPRETQRLLLRRPSPDYAEAIREAIEETFNDLHVWMFWAKELQSIDETREYLTIAESKFLEGEDFGFSVFHKQSGKFVLAAGLHPRNWGVPSFEIGYWCRSSMQRQGFTTETVKALTEIAFKEMAANRVEIRCDARNIHSRRVAELAGYSFEAELQSHDRANDGSLRDTVIYALFTDELGSIG
jgi:RimJ/RimL family protein N-acetyltransferase